MSNLVFIEKDSSTNDNGPDKLCKICKTNPWKYTCPRCNLNYCTVPCYQSEAHGNCSEAFYRDCIMEEMGAEVGNPESEKKMMEILVRMQQEPTLEELESDEDDCEPDLEDRLSSVNLDDADAVWEKLTAAERQGFEQLLQSGDASDLLPPWTPWWEFKVEKKLITDVDEKPNEEMSYAVNCPKLKKKVKSLSQITSVPPSSVVRNSAVNVVSAYCVSARWCNGRLDGAEAAHALAALSGALAEGRSYASADLAMSDVAQRALDCPWLGFTAEARLTMRSDVHAVFQGPEQAQRGFYLAALLSHALALISAAKAGNAQDGKPGNAQDGKASISQDSNPGTSKDSNPGTAQEGKAGTAPEGKAGNAGSFTRRFGANVTLPAPSRVVLKAAARKLDYLLSWAASGGEGQVCGEGVLERLEGEELLGL